jgi:cell division septation protein DedD
LLNKPSSDDQIIKALKGFPIVEDVIKIRNTLVIKVDNEQWDKLATVQKNIFAKTVHGFVNANLTVEAIYIKNMQGGNLAYLQKGDAGNNYMVVAGTVTEKLETEKELEAPFDLEKALSTEDTDLQNIAAVSAESVENRLSDFSHRKDIPDITFKELAIEPAPQPVAHQKSKYGVLYKILIVFVVAIIANVAGYYFSFKQQEQAKQSFELFKKAAPARGTQTQIDKKSHIIKPTVQDQKTADNKGIEPGRMESSQTAVPPTDKKGTAFPTTKETKTAEPSPAGALIDAKPVHPTIEEKKAKASFQQKATINGTMYCVNVALCKLKESADVVIKDLQKKGYEPAGDTITVNGTTWYRVTLGNFQTQSEAQNYAKELQGKENIDGFVVKKKQ